jgi:predicted nucleic acid-binding Zn ribbon protein
MPEPRKIGDIVSQALDRLVGSDEARAFQLWHRAAGAQVASVTQPIRFARGTLTVVCESSVWTNELTYLGGTLLERLRALDPSCPVERLRFVTGKGPRQQGNEPLAAK